MLKVVNTLKAPAAIGPYSQGIILKNILFSSGQIPASLRQERLWELILRLRQSR